MPSDAQSSGNEQAIDGFKGFDRTLRCRGFQYEIGGTYTMNGGVQVCARGFHACPLTTNVFGAFEVYPPGKSRYCRVLQSGDIDRDQRKAASTTITVLNELSLADVARLAVDSAIQRARDLDRVTEDRKQSNIVVASKPDSMAVAYNNNPIAIANYLPGGGMSNGPGGIADASGMEAMAIATRERSISRARGLRGVAVTTALTCVAVAEGYTTLAASCGTASVAVSDGVGSVAIASGSLSAARSVGAGSVAVAPGYQCSAQCDGANGVAFAAGKDGRVRGDVDGVSLFAREMREITDGYGCDSVACGITGVDGINAGVWYVCRDGKLVEAEE